MGMLRHHATYAVAVVGIGAAAGVVGASLFLLLTGVEMVVWGMSSGEDVLVAISATPASFRILAVAGAGVVGGVVWWTLKATGHAPVPLGRAVQGVQMPFGRTIVHVVTQVFVVGAGLSIGKEVAPRELSASAAGWIADRLGLTPEERTIVVVSAAGAGLAAVYSVPLAGAAFALELLIVRHSIRGWVTAIATSFIAFGVARFVVGNEPYYRLPDLQVSPSLVVWALIAGPTLGLVGLGFSRLVERMDVSRFPAWWPMAALPVVGAVVGLIAVWVPELLGNGHSVAQAAFSADPSTEQGSVLAFAGLLVGLGVLKAVATLATIGAGAWGGTLTPGLAVGAALGAGTGLAWSLAFPGSVVAAFAYVGAAIVLSVVLRGPITAILLVAEFTHSAGWMLLPTVIGVAGAVAVYRWFDRNRRVS